MDSAFAKIEDPTTSEKVESLPLAPPLPEAKEDKKADPKSKSKQVQSSSSGLLKYFVIFAVIVLIVGVIIFFVVRPSADELSASRKELEMMRHNEAALKTRVNAYEEQLRRMKAAEQQRQQAPQTFLHQFDDHDVLPAEGDYDDVPVDEDPTMRRKPDPRVEDRKKIMAMVNQKRETVADMQAEAEAKREKVRQMQADRIQAELEEKTQSSLYKDEKAKEAIFDAVANGGSLVDN